MTGPLKTWKGIATLEQAPPAPVITIGNFDGVHRGHQVIIAETVRQARALGGTPLAYTFRPHPRIALGRGPVELITSYDEKTKLLGGFGLAGVIEEPFNAAYAARPPEDFFAEDLRKKLGARAVVVGHDFGFGRGREGQLEKLGELCRAADIKLTVIPPQLLDGETISSSAIRACLQAGRLREATRLLGRPFGYTGRVEAGEGRGRQLGYPTANIPPEEGKVILPHGIYATWTWVGGRRYRSATNFGVRPMFTSAESAPAVLVEPYLIGERLDLYGREIQVQFVARLRDEKKFASVEELTAQIARDVGDAVVALEAAEAEPAPPTFH